MLFLSIRVKTLNVYIYSEVFNIFEELWFDATSKTLILKSIQKWRKTIIAWDVDLLTTIVVINELDVLCVWNMPNVDRYWAVAREINNAGKYF